MCNKRTMFWCQIFIFMHLSNKHLFFFVAILFIIIHLLFWSFILVSSWGPFDTHTYIHTHTQYTDPTTILILYVEIGRTCSICVHNIFLHPLKYKDTTAAHTCWEYEKQWKFDADFITKVRREIFKIQIRSDTVLHNNAPGSFHQ